MVRCFNVYVSREYVSSISRERVGIVMASKMRQDHHIGKGIANPKRKCRPRSVIALIKAQTRDSRSAALKVPQHRRLMPEINLQGLSSQPYSSIVFTETFLSRTSLGVL